MFLIIFDIFECEAMYLKSACPECLVKAEGAEDLTTWPLVVINHSARIVLLRFGDVIGCDE